MQGDISSGYDMKTEFLGVVQFDIGGPGPAVLFEPGEEGLGPLYWGQIRWGY